MRRMHELQPALREHLEKASEEGRLRVYTQDCLFALGPVLTDCLVNELSAREIHAFLRSHPDAPLQVGERQLRRALAAIRAYRGLPPARHGRRVRTPRGHVPGAASALPLGHLRPDPPALSASGSAPVSPVPSFSPSVRAVPPLPAEVAPQSAPQLAAAAPGQPGGGPAGASMAPVPLRDARLTEAILHDMAHPEEAEAKRQRVRQLAREETLRRHRAETAVQQAAQGSPPR